MSKLISNPTECGYREQKSINPTIPIRCTCYFQSAAKQCVLSRIVCSEDKTFPTNCPLHDGQPFPKSIGELIVLVEQEREKIRNSNVLKPERRNRKDCIHYADDGDPRTTCSAPHRSFVCSGVKCGCFKTK